jgi:hypothetical protein
MLNLPFNFNEGDSMTLQQQLLIQTAQDLLQAVKRLNKSYKKIEFLSTDLDQLDDEMLEAWESFVSRFARTSDIFMSRYLRTWVSMREGGFRGSMRDFCDYAEKHGFMDSSDLWMEIRELRNQIAHEYANQKLSKIFGEARRLAPHVINLKEVIK